MTSKMNNPANVYILEQRRPSFGMVRQREASVISIVSETSTFGILAPIASANGHATHISDNSLSISDVASSDEENKVRGNWSRRLEFILSCIGYSVGLGNIWRFPYICYKNGGGAFIVPYILMMLICGVPLFFLEVAFGQYASLGPVTIWKATPLLKGIGIGMVIVSLLTSVYYNMVIAWASYYMFASMQSPLPWQSCGNAWNTKACRLNKYVPPFNCTAVNGTLHYNNGTCLNVTNGNDASSVVLGVEDASLLNITRFFTPSEEYFHNYMLELSDGVHNLGTVRWPLVLCLMFGWLLLFLCLLKGIKSSGKVVYFTAVFPYVVLMILLIRGSMLDGASTGVLYFLSPNWSRLKSAQVWIDAAVQVFFSLGPAFGSLITLASYNKFHNNCYRDTWLVVIINFVTSILAGFTVFTVLGYLAKSLNTTVDKVARHGVEIAFIVYPEVCAMIPGAPFWSCLFFFMLITLGADSQFTFVETVVTSITDEFSQKLQSKRIWVILVYCVLMFLLGIPLTTQGGLYIFLLMDAYTASWSLLVIAIMECVAISWIYGFDKFASDIENMTGKRPGDLWKWLWKIGAPLILVSVLIFQWVEYEDIRYGSYVLPHWFNVIGWMMVPLALIPIPVYMCYALIFHSRGSIKERFKFLLKHSSDWGPALDIHREFLKLSIPEYVNGGIEHPDYDPNCLEKGDGSFYLQENRDAHMLMADQIDTGSINWEEDENSLRGNWDKRPEFFFTCLGYTLGLGNVIRFPYLCYQNGGGAFLVPYVMMLVFIGIPLYYLEVAIGQYSSLGPTQVWKAVPLFKGLGYSMCAVSIVFCIYYSIWIAWSLFFMISSMTSELPWQTCNNTWNTALCSLNKYAAMNLKNFNSTNLTTTVMPINSANVTSLNESLHLRPYVELKSSAEEFFFNHMLNISHGIEELGEVRWHVSLCLLFTWVIAFFCASRGIKSIGKVCMVIVPIALTILTALLIRACTVEGYLTGIKHFITPDWHKLSSASVWYDAASQMFFTLSTGYGGLIMLASYNRFHVFCYRDAVLVAVCDCLFSILSGFMTFAVIGIMAHQLGTTVEAIINNDIDYMYIVFPEGMLNFELAPLWCSLFFFMIFLVGMGTLFVTMETIVLVIVEEIPSLFKYKVWVCGATGGALFLLGLPLTFQGGIYVQELLGGAAIGIPLLVIGIMECVVLAWVYGTNKLLKNIKVMLEDSSIFWWKTMWTFITPAIILFTIIFYGFDYKPPNYGNFIYPWWTDIIHWSVTVLCIIPIPVYLLYKIITTEGSCYKRLKRTTRASRDWGPALEKHRAYVEFLQPNLLRRCNSFSTVSALSVNGNWSVTSTPQSTRKIFDYGTPPLKSGPRLNLAGPSSVNSTPTLSRQITDKSLRFALTKKDLEENYVASASPQLPRRKERLPSPLTNNISLTEDEGIFCQRKIMTSCRDVSVQTDPLSPIHEQPVEPRGKSGRHHYVKSSSRISSNSGSSSHSNEDLAMHLATAKSLKESNKDSAIEDNTYSGSSATTTTDDSDEQNASLSEHEQSSVDSDSPREETDEKRFFSPPAYDSLTHERSERPSATDPHNISAANPVFTPLSTDDDSIHEGCDDSIPHLLTNETDAKHLYPLINVATEMVTGKGGTTEKDFGVGGSSHDCTTRL